eukprot:189663_1
MRRFLVCILLLNICQAKDFFRSITSIFDDDKGDKPCTFAASGINDVKLPKLSTSSTSADQFDFDHDFAELILDQIEDDYSVCTDPDTPDESTSPAQHILMDSETLSPDIQGDQLFARRVIQRVGSDQKSKQFQKYERKSTRKPSVSFPRSISPQSTQNYHLQPKNKRQSSTHLSDIDIISYLRAKTKFYESKLVQSQQRISQNVGPNLRTRTSKSQTLYAPARPIPYLRAKNKFYESSSRSQRMHSVPFQTRRLNKNVGQNVRARPSKSQPSYSPRPIYDPYNSSPVQRTVSHQSVSEYPHSSQSLSHSKPPFIRPNSFSDITDFKQNSKREKSEEDTHNDSFEPQYWIDDKDRKNKDFEVSAKFLIFDSESEEYENSSSGSQKYVYPRGKSREFKIPCVAYEDESLSIDNSKMMSRKKSCMTTNSEFEENAHSDSYESQFWIDDEDREKTLIFDSEYKYGHSGFVSQQCKSPKTKVRKSKRPRDSLPRNSPYSSHHLHVVKVLPITKDLQLELSSDSDEESRSRYSFSSHAASVADTLSLGAADSNSAIHYIDIEDSDVSHEDTGERFNLNSTCFKYLSSRRNDLLSA